MKVFALIQNRHSVYNFLGLFDSFVYEKISGYSIKTGEVTFFESEEKAISELALTREIEFRLGKSAATSQAIIILNLNEDNILQLERVVEFSGYDDEKKAYTLKATGIENINFSKGAVAALQQEYNKSQDDINNKSYREPENIFSL
jgi:hypothetical protein